MNRNSTCTFILSLMFAAAALAPGPASARNPRIFKTCQAILAARFRPLTQTKLAISSQALAELKLAYSAALEKQLKRRTFFNGDAIPEQFMFNGRPIQTETFLNSGGEGAVYLALDHGQRIVLKQFYSPDHMKRNFITARLLRKRGIKVLEPLETGNNAAMAIFPHIHGLDLYEIVGSEFYKNPLISESTRLEIQEAYRIYTETLLPAYQFYHPHQQPFAKSNIMLDLDRQEFIMIDSQ